MSEDEILAEFETRIHSLIKRGINVRQDVYDGSAVQGLIPTYNGGSWSVSSNLTNYSDVMVPDLHGITRYIYQRVHNWRGKLLCSTHYAEEILKSMRLDMVLDDLADV